MASDNDDGSRHLLLSLTDEGRTPLPPHTYEALRGDRDSSLLMWARVSEGEFSPDVLVWLRVVATRIRKADGESNKRKRAGGLVTAVGLKGVRDQHRQMRTTLTAAKYFNEDIDMKGLIALARERRFIKKNLDEKDAAELIRRELNKWPACPDPELSGNNGEFMSKLRSFLSENKG